MSYSCNTNGFSITKHSNSIVTVKPNDEDAETTIGFVGQALRFVDQLTLLLKEEDVKGVLYYPLFPHPRMRFKRLFEEHARLLDFQEKLFELLTKVELLKKQDKPLVAYLQNRSVGLNLSVSLWAHYSIIEEGAVLEFSESKYGLLPGFGGIDNILKHMPLSEAYNFLTQSNVINAIEAVESGILTRLIKKNENPFMIAEQIILNHKSTLCRYKHIFTDEEITLFHSLSQNSIRKTRGLNPGVNAMLKIMESIFNPSDAQSLEIEALEYTATIANKNTQAMVRTRYYLVGDIKRNNTSSFQLSNVGVIGAGMMGAGIAFEIAKIGANVYLKDTSIALAEKGKAYSEQVCQKMIKQGRMNFMKSNSILSNIHPVTEFSSTVSFDLMIEAVFEDIYLKKEVISSNSCKLKQSGVFATNTTSLPITELAKASLKPKQFIGLHFFSPVERMNLVEIVKGQQTSNEVVAQAMAIVFNMDKTAIVVNDGPGFFTSRVFFNYLLEAITMLLEGVPASIIESEAYLAGFGASPLALLDEISLPLMLHVYEQFPTLTNSQQRAYDYLANMIANGRSGRKGKQGFYNYEADKKELWLGSSLPPSETTYQKVDIAKRLLQVMSLDSYRCLDEGILEQPSDGDLGTTLGIGFPQHIGGVFSYIDQLGLPQFVKDCESFTSKGEQWQIPTSLYKLAAKNYRFYEGMKSNWK